MFMGSICRGLYLSRIGIQLVGKGVLMNRIATGFCPLLFLALAGVPAGYARAQNHAPTEVASLNERAQPSSGGPPGDSTTGTTAKAAAPTSGPSSSADSDVPSAVVKELDAMRERIEELEAELKKSHAASEEPVAAPATATADPTANPTLSKRPAAEVSESNSANPVQGQAPAESSSAAPAAPAAPNFDPQKKTKSDPFAWADWTWMNNAPRTEDTPLATKYFTPEIRADSNYIEDYNQPKDHTMGGSTESFRNGEVQLEQMSVGGDLHIDNVRGRLLTMAGLFSTTTPRNDGCAGVGASGTSTAPTNASRKLGAAITSTSSTV
jgi:hypothetical protein